MTQTILNQGDGECLTTHTVIFSATQLAHYLGNVSDVLKQITQAVHSINRTNEHNQRIAIAFPDLVNARKTKGLGTTLQLFGTESVLNTLIENKVIKRLGSQNFVRPSKIISVSDYTSENSVIPSKFVREQAVAKQTLSGIKRDIRHINKKIEKLKEGVYQEIKSSEHTERLIAFLKMKLEFLEGQLQSYESASIEAKETSLPYIDSKKPGNRLYFRILATDDDTKQDNRIHVSTFGFSSSASDGGSLPVLKY